MGFLTSIVTGLAVAPGEASAGHQRRGRGGSRRGRGQRRPNQFRPNQFRPNQFRPNQFRPKSFYQEGPANRSSGQDRARRALQEGRVLPLGDIMGMLSRRFPGKVLDADLVRDGNRFVYYLKVLDPQGRVAEVAVDGQSGRVLGVKGPRQ